jgi:hypothetical protein
MKASTKGLLIAGGISVLAVTFWLILKPKDKKRENVDSEQSDPIALMLENELMQPNQIFHNGKSYTMVLGTGVYRKNRYWKDENGDTWVKVGAGVGATKSGNTGKIIKTGMDFNDYTK